MSKQDVLPKWATPERKAVLVELWRLFGNKCLYGHPVCSDVTHYINIEAKTTWASKPVYLPRKDSSGNPIRGEYLKLYTSVKVNEYEANYARLYDVKAEEFINDWKAEDRITRAEQYRLESIALHGLAEPTKPLRGQFSAISKDIWQSSQPLYYIENMAISGLTLKPFVKVRLASSYMRLHVNLGDTLRGVSRNKKRKAIRYGKPLPQTIEETIISLVNKAVNDYLAH